MAIVVAITIFNKQRNQRRLDFEIISKVSLLSMKDELEGKVQILYEDRAIRSVHLSVLEIANSGSEPILPTDFIQSPRVTFGNKSQLLTCEVIETSPPDLHPKITVENVSFVLAPLLLNQGDYLRVKCLVEGEDGKAECSGRIVGIKKIESPGEGEVLPSLMVWGGLLTLAAGMAFLLWVPAKESSPAPSPPLSANDIWAFVILGMGLLLLFGGLLTDRSTRKQARRALSFLLQGLTGS